MNHLQNSLDRADHALRDARSGLEQHKRRECEQVRQLRHDLDVARAAQTLPATELAEIESLLESFAQDATVRPMATITRRSAPINASWLRI